MLRKFMAFIGNILLIPVVLGAIALFSQSLITTEQITCELQENQFYTCTAQDLIFGLKVSEVTAENVYSVDYDLKCSKSSKGRGCTSFAHFQKDNGESIPVSKRYKDSDQVRKMTDQLNSLMSEKSPSIDMSFPPSIFALIIVGVIAVIFTIIFLITAFSSFFTH